jgi:peptide/nickel transport system substrate-binding protein
VLRLKKFLVALLCGFILSVQGIVYGETVYTIGDTTGDWGMPAPYLHYSRGPGYVRMSLVFDSLLWKDRGGLVGLLAREWSYDKKGNAYIFTLRDNVRWHDGTPFTPDDVVFTFEYYKKYPYQFADISNIVKKVERLGQNKIKISLSYPYAPFLTNIAGTIPIIPRHIYKDIQNPLQFADPRCVIGTGPFILKTYDKASGLYIFEANKDYYLGNVRVDQLRIVKVNNQVIPSLLTSGQLDAAGIAPEMVPGLKEKGLNIIKSTYDWNAKLVFNHKRYPFSDVRFRKAVAYAIDRERIVKIALRGNGRVGSPGILSPDNPYYTEGLEEYRQDIEKSKELLSKVNYTKDITIIYAQNFDQCAQLIKEDLTRAGLKVTLKSMEQKTVDALINNWRFDIAISGHGGLGGDPDILYRVILGSGFNSARYYSNKRLTELLLKQRFTLDDELRRRLIGEIQKIYADEIPTLTLYYPDSYWAFNNRIELYYVKGGLGNGVPIPLNKLAFVDIKR